jgi:hypothetical protein
MVASNGVPQVVFMVEDKKLHLRSYLQSCGKPVVYLRGSALSFADLKRAAVHSALAIFIIPHRVRGRTRRCAGGV